MVDLLRVRADQLGSTPAFRLLRERGGDEVVVSFAQLHERAKAIGGYLQARFQPGERALLLYPPGIDFIAAFFGCLYAGIVAVPVSPHRRRRSNPSLQAICSASSPSTVLSTAADGQQAAEFYADVPALLALPWIAIDTDCDGPSARWVDPRTDSAGLAFLQYTSGSTAEPKGVMLSHGNLLHNLTLIYDSFGNSEHSSAVFWLPLYHDMGLIGGVLQPIYCGGTCTLLAAAAFLHRPRLWLETITSYRAMVSGGPDFAYDLCVRKIAPEDRQGLDLSCWRLAFTGAEPIRSQTLDRFAESFGPCGFQRQAFFPCYGLAEATLIVSGGPRESEPAVVRAEARALAEHRVIEVADGEPARCVVGCGQPLPGQRVAVVDPLTALEFSDDRVGEIWVRGPSVAGGYFGRAEATEATFGARLADTGEGPFLRTGDLGFLRGGQLFVTGRVKDLIIVRGRNYYPADIEQTVEQAYAGFRPGYCAAFSTDVDGQERLVVVQEVEPRHRQLNADLAIQAVRAAVAEHHELEVHGIVLTAAGTIPKTSSGKTRRSLCRDQYLQGELASLAQWQAPLDDSPTNGHEHPIGEQAATAQQIEQWLIARIAGRLQCDPAEIRSGTPFLDFGLGSLDAVQIVADLESRLGRPISPTAIYNHPNIHSLAHWLAANSPDGDGSPSHSDAGPAERVDDLLREVQQASEQELESFILQELARQRALPAGPSALPSNSAAAE